MYRRVPFFTPWRASSSSSRRSNRSGRETRSCSTCRSFRHDHQAQRSFGVRGVQLRDRRRAVHAVRGQGHAAGPRAHHRREHIPHDVPVRVPPVPVLAHAPAHVRLPGAADRLRGRRLRALPAHILCAQRHVPQPVPGQAGLVLDAAVHRVVPGGLGPGAVPGFAAYRRHARRPARGGHVLLVVLDHRVQPARGVLGPLLGAQARPRHPYRVPGGRPRVEAVRRVWPRLHTHLQHAGNDQRGAAVRRLGQDPGRAAQGRERAHGGQDRGHHVQHPVRQRSVSAQGSLQADDAVRAGAVRRDHRVRRRLGADAHHHHDVLPLDAREAVGRHRGHVHVVRNVQGLVRLVGLAAAARRRVLQVPSASKERSRYLTRVPPPLLCVMTIVINSCTIIIINFIGVLYSLLLLFPSTNNSTFK